MLKYKLIFDNNEEKEITTLNELIINEKEINNMSLNMYGYIDPCILERTYLIKKILIDIENKIKFSMKDRDSCVLKDHSIIEKIDMGDKVVGIKVEI